MGSGLRRRSSSMTSPSSFRADSLPNMNPYLKHKSLISKMETSRHLSRNPQFPMKRERESVCVFVDVPVGNGREDAGCDHCVKQSKGFLHFFGFRFRALYSYFKASSFLMFQTHPSKFLTLLVSLSRFC